MNNGTLKRAFISSIIISAVCLPVWVVTFVTLPHDLWWLIIAIPFFGGLNWLIILCHLNVADLYLDKANGTLIIMTLFKEKTVPLKDLEIKGYHFWPSWSGAKLHTSIGSIPVYYTAKNCRAIFNLLLAKGYPHMDRFLEAVNNNNWGIWVSY